MVISYLSGPDGGLPRNQRPLIRRRQDTTHGYLVYPRRTPVRNKLDWLVLATFDFSPPFLPSSSARIILLRSHRLPYLNIGCIPGQSLDSLHVA